MGAHPGTAAAQRTGRPFEVRRVAAISMHTSPLTQPGTGDAGGLNTYVMQTARRLAARGVAVEIFTRATSSDLPPVAHVEDGVLVRHVVAGPFEGLHKEDLPGQLCSFTAGVLRAPALRRPGFYDVVHSHYWLSGQSGFLVRDRWGIPLVHSAHTLARVKNAALAESDEAEPQGRLIGEDQVVAESDRLIANTDDEARALIELYDADPDRLDVVAPGVDTEVFAPGDQVAARATLGVPAGERLIVFAGRIQPLKAPDVLVRALGVLRRRFPDEPWRLWVIGGLSGTGRRRPDRLAALAVEHGVADLVEFRAPLAADDLATAFRAADVVAVPSHNESFGLVALEAQASGTPVVAAAVGGLVVAVKDGISGVLVPGHDAETWADRLSGVILHPVRRAVLARGARAHAVRFSWDVTVDGLLDSYHKAAVGLRPHAAELAR